MPPPRTEREATSDPASADAGVAMTVNGVPVSVRSDHPHLLAALREELDITSPKDGCSPSGQCGCCTVHVDGKAVVSCQMPLSKAAGKSVVTLEGVEQAERDSLRRGVRRVRRPAVRVLHPWDRDAGEGADRQEGRGALARRHEPSPRRAPLPVHRVRQDPRCDRRGRQGGRAPFRARERDRRVAARSTRRPS